MESMEKEKELLKQAANLLNINMQEEALNKFMEYKSMLVEWNEKFNLTAITESKEIILKHFIDSLTLLKFIESVESVESMENGKNLKVIDVGTGAGFPSVPLKIMLCDMELVLLDSVNKKVNFLTELSKHLNLTKTTCVHDRAENLAQSTKYREQFDFCVTRAVSKMNVVAEYCLPFVKLGGKFISMKSVSAIDEINEAKTAILKLGGEISCIETVNIPYTDIKHLIIVADKKAKTPTHFPRKAGKPLKSPII